MVHYVSFGTPGGEYRSVCRSATIAEVGGWVTVGNNNAGLGSGVKGAQRIQEWDPEACALVVANPTGLFFKTCPYHGGDPGHVDATPTYRGGTWHWPERV
jgi:hypothetical protein